MKVGHTSLGKSKPNEKKVVTFVDENFHGRFRIQLRYDDLAQAKFFRICMEAYESRNPEFMEFLYRKLENEKSRKKKRMIKKDTNEMRKNEENFGLNDDEIKDIFDVIAMENPDL
jgi:hypothetical protein